MAVNVTKILNSRRHNTKSEILARLDAEAAVTRDKVTIRPPDRVKREIAALKYWRDTVRQMRGIDLLDDLDTEMLASYCLQSAIRDQLSSQYAETQDPNVLKSLQNQERLILSYAGKLGLTAESRARLAKRRADEQPKANKFARFGDTG